MGEGSRRRQKGPTTTTLLDIFVAPKFVSPSPQLLSEKLGKLKSHYITLETNPTAFDFAQQPAYPVPFPR
jgi:hypothetical protein